MCMAAVGGLQSPTVASLADRPPLVSLEPPAASTSGLNSAVCTVQLREAGSQNILVVVCGGSGGGSDGGGVYGGGVWW